MMVTHNYIQITVASFLGAAKGALVSVTSLFFLSRIYPSFKTIRLPVKIFYHSALITTGVIFACEAQLNRFQIQYYQNELQKREKLLNEAADKGIFLDENYIATSVVTDE